MSYKTITDRDLKTVYDDLSNAYAVLQELHQPVTAQKVSEVRAEVRDLLIDRCATDPMYVDKDKFKN